MKHKNIIILKDVAKKKKELYNKVYLIFEYYEHDLAGLMRYPIRL